MLSPTDKKTIEDFGKQWNRYRGNRGYYASLELFASIAGPHFDRRSLTEASVVEIGSGSGRVVTMLLQSGVERVIAVEPSLQAFGVLKRNTEAYREQIDYRNVPGEEFSARDLDVAVSFGVLHHIRAPEATVRRMYEALKPGGRCVVWLYAREGNRIYLAFVEPLRRLTRVLPAPVLAVVCHAVVAAMVPYLWTSRWLPSSRYLREHFRKLGWRERVLTVFDQLNPRYAKYYCRAEAVELLANAGFVDVKAHHRLGYSWTVVGAKSHVAGDGDRP